MIVNIAEECIEARISETMMAAENSCDVNMIEEFRHALRRYLSGLEPVIQAEISNLDSREVSLVKGAARTQTPAVTNYDVHSPTWGDVRQARPLSAMRADYLGHKPY